MKIKGQAWRQGGWLLPVLTRFTHQPGSAGGLPTWQEMVQNALLLLPSGLPKGKRGEQSCTCPGLSSVALFSTLAVPENRLVTS